jgi:hypothetical protein
MGRWAVEQLSASVAAARDGERTLPAGPVLLPVRLEVRGSTASPPA